MSDRTISQCHAKQWIWSYSYKKLCHCIGVVKLLLQKRETRTTYYIWEHPSPYCSSVEENIFLTLTSLSSVIVEVGTCEPSRIVQGSACKCLNKREVMVEVGTSSQQYLNHGHAWLINFSFVVWIAIHVLCIFYTHIHSKKFMSQFNEFFKKKTIVLSHDQ